jgi:hypothetical protein
MKIDLGCGRNKKEGCFGIDIQNFDGVDLVCDCNQRIPLDDSIADEIHADDFLEHLQNDKRIHIISEIWRILKPDGKFYSYTPSTDGRGAYQDPTHYSFWNENSFKYYILDEYRNQHNIEAKFSVVELRTTRPDNNKVCFVYSVLKAIKPMKFSIVCASNNEKLINEHLLSSPEINNHELIIDRKAKNVPAAYNKAMKKATQDIVIFVHHDVSLPEGFFDQLTESIKKLTGDWGCLGVAGCVGADRYGYLMNRRNVWGAKDKVPHEVDTLDELILIVKRDSVVFDENIPSTHHMFGPDTCLQFRSEGKKNYAILAYCTHNCVEHGTYPKEFYDSAEYIKKKWAKFLPIHTTCTTIN